jgi:hypothetical protein
MNAAAMDASPILPGAVGTGQPASAAPVNFSVGLAQMLAMYSADAYTEANIHDPHTNAEAQVTLFRDSSGFKIIVAFTGSHTTKDFIQDAKFEMRRLGYSTAMNPAYVHAGFLEDAAIDARVTLEVRNLLAVHPDGQVFVTGHSLGGAIALLCAVELRRSGIQVAGVYTFGQPRVGNSAWAAMYEQALGDRTFRVVNENDIVPRTPGVLMGYRHCGNEVLLLPWHSYAVNTGWFTKLMSDASGLYEVYKLRKDVLILDHFIAAYQAALVRLK